MAISFLVSAIEFALYIAFLILYPISGLPFTVAAVLLATPIMLIVEVFTLYYFSFAMIIGLKELLNGGKSGLLKNLSETWKYSRLVFEWAIFEGIIIYVFERVGISARGIVGGLSMVAGGMALGAANFFVAQIIIDKKLGPVKSIVMSSEMMTKNGIMPTIFRTALSGDTLKRMRTGKSIYKTLLWKVLLIIMLIGAALFLYGVFGLSLHFLRPVHSLYYVVSGAFIVGSLFMFMIIGPANLYKTVMYDYFSGERAFKKMYLPIPK